MTYIFSSLNAIYCPVNTMLIPSLATNCSNLSLREFSF